MPVTGMPWRPEAPGPGQAGKAGPATGPAVSRNGSGRSVIEHVISDGLWRTLEPIVLSPARHRTGRPPIDDRRVLEGILYVLRQGIGWERLRRWQANGVWSQLQGTLADGLPDAARYDWTRAEVGNSTHACGRLRPSGLPEHCWRHARGAWPERHPGRGRADPSRSPPMPARAGSRAGLARIVQAIELIQAAGVTSARGIARELMDRGVPTIHGNRRWQAIQVQRILARLARGR